MSGSDEDLPGLPRAQDVNWDIRRAGRAWQDEAMERYQLKPEKLEVYRGKLLWSEQERLLLLGLLPGGAGLGRRKEA